MRLHYAEVLNPRKVCAFAKHVGAPLEYVRVDLGAGEHLRATFRGLNPNARVPVLEDDGQTFWEADAILCHLALRCGSPMWPRDARQVDVMRWLSWNQAHFQPLVGKFYFEGIIKPMFGLGPRDEALLAANQKPLKRAAKVLDEHLAGRRFLLGEQPTIADFSVAVSLPYRIDAQIPLDAYPAILRWGERMDRLEGWRDPFPSRAAAA